MLENFIPFVFKGATVSGNLSLKSNKIDLNEFMAKKETAGKPEEKQEEPAEDDSPMSVIEVPKNIDFEMNVNIGRLLFDKIDVANTAGTVVIKDGILRMRNLAMNLLEGSVALTGEYDTADIKAPKINLGANISRVDVGSAISTFDIIKKILPYPQNYAGKVSANITLSGLLNDNFKPVLDTVTSKGRLQTHNVRIQNSELFGTMANLLKNEALRTPTLDNINIGYEIKDGRLSIEPLRFNIAQTNMELTGSQGLDMTMDYKINATVPLSVIGTGATDVLSRIPGGSNIRDVKVTGLIGGTVTKPVVTLSVADTVNSVVETVKEAVKEVVKEQAQAVKQQVKEEVDKQVAAVMAEAERQAQTIRNTAKQTADGIRGKAKQLASETRSQANAKANQIEAAASNPLQKAAAKLAADKLREEGEAGARKIEQEGETNAKKTEQEAEKQVAAVMDTARKKAEEIKNR